MTFPSINNTSNRTSFTVQVAPEEGYAVVEMHLQRLVSNPGIGFQVTLVHVIGLQPVQTASAPQLEPVQRLPYTFTEMCAQHRYGRHTMCVWYD